VKEVIQRATNSEVPMPLTDTWLQEILFLEKALWKRMPNFEHIHSVVLTEVKESKVIIRGWLGSDKQPLLLIV